MLKAVTNGDADALAALLAKGGNPNERNKKGETLLHIADDDDVIDALLAANADVNARDKRTGATPLVAWIRDGSNPDAVARLLRTRRADVNLGDTDGDTPLHWAVNVGAADDVDALLAARADANKTNGRGDTPLHVAASLDTDDGAELVRALVERGQARPAMKNADGLNALAVAASCGATAVVRALLEHSAGDARAPLRRELCHATTDDGDTPAHLAARDGNTAAYRLLVDAEPAVLDMRSADGTTLRELAASSGVDGTGDGAAAACAAAADAGGADATSVADAAERKRKRAEEKKSAAAAAAASKQPHAASHDDFESWLERAERRHLVRPLRRSGIKCFRDAVNAPRRDYERAAMTTMTATTSNATTSATTASHGDGASAFARSAASLASRLRRSAGVSGGTSSAKSARALSTSVSNATSSSPARPARSSASTLGKGVAGGGGGGGGGGGRVPPPLTNDDPEL